MWNEKKKLKSCLTWQHYNVTTGSLRVSFVYCYCLASLAIPSYCSAGPTHRLCTRGHILLILETLISIYVYISWLTGLLLSRHGANEGLICTRFTHLALLFGSVSQACERGTPCSTWAGQLWVLRQLKVTHRAPSEKTKSNWIGHTLQWPDTLYALWRTSVREGLLAKRE